MIKRKAYFKVLESIESKRIPILLGMRRLGKTTILKQLRDHYGHDCSAIISLDSFNNFSKSSEEIFNKISHLIEGGKINKIFIDEVQELEEWNLLVKNLYDVFVESGKCSFAVTGSSSLLIERMDTGVNRTEKILLSTLDFDEYKNIKNINSDNDNEKLFNEFLGSGGFPGEISDDNGVGLEFFLENILYPIIRDDIPKHHKVSVFTLSKFITLLASSTNGEINVSSYCSALSVDSRQLKNFIDILVKSQIAKIVNRIKPDGTMHKNSTYKIYLNPHIILWILNKKITAVSPQRVGYIIESYWLFAITQLNGYYKQMYYIKDSNNNEIDFVSLGGLFGEFKSLHDFKYSDTVKQSDLKLLKSMKSKNKVVWYKGPTKTMDDGLINYVCIFDKLTKSN